MHVTTIDIDIIQEQGVERIQQNIPLLDNVERSAELNTYSYC